MFIVALYASVGLPIGAPKSDVLDLSTATATLRQLRSDFVGTPRNLLAPPSDTIDDNVASVESPLESSIENNLQENQSVSPELDAISAQDVTPRSSSFMESPAPNQSNGDLESLSPPTVTTISTCLSGSCLSAGQAEPATPEATAVVHADVGMEAAALEMQQLATETTMVKPEVRPNGIVNNKPPASKVAEQQLARSEVQVEAEAEAVVTELAWLEASPETNSHAGAERTVQTEPAAPKASANAELDNAAQSKPVVHNAVDDTLQKSEVVVLEAGAPGEEPTWQPTPLEARADTSDVSNVKSPEGL